MLLAMTLQRSENIVIALSGTILELLEQFIIVVFEDFVEQEGATQCERWNLFGHHKEKLWLLLLEHIRFTNDISSTKFVRQLIAGFIDASYATECLVTGRNFALLNEKHFRHFLPFCIKDAFCVVGACSFANGSGS